FQAPFEITGNASVDVVVVRGGLVSQAEAIAVLPGIPALFTANQAGEGPVAALHADYSAVTTLSPAKRGEVILLFGTGLGKVHPEVESGNAPPEGAKTLGAV